MQCLQEPNCVSYNFKKNGENKCDLNSVTYEQNNEHSGDLAKNENYVYREAEVSMKFRIESNYNFSLKSKTLNKFLELFWTRPRNLVQDIFKFQIHGSKPFGELRGKTQRGAQVRPVGRGTQAVVKGNISCPVGIHRAI